MHQIFTCPKHCERLHSPCNRSCQKMTCGEDCGSCMVKLDNILLPCGHLKDQVSCYETQGFAKIKCTILVERLIPGCRHTVTVRCWADVTSPSFKCPNPCGTNLPCGHTCSGTCSSCKATYNDQVVFKHSECTKICDRGSGTCNHTCPKKCHEGKTVVLVSLLVR